MPRSGPLSADYPAANNSHVCKCMSHMQTVLMRMSAFVPLLRILLHDVCLRFSIHDMRDIGHPNMIFARTNDGKSGT